MFIIRIIIGMGGLRDLKQGSKMEGMKLVDDGCCFACGMNNLDGLRIAWKVEGQTMTGEFMPQPKFQGWQGVVHGGILATLLDEAMTRLAAIVYGGAVTAEMTVRYVAPARIGEKLHIRGEIVSGSSRLAELKAEITDASGVVIARSTGKVIIRK